MEITENCRCPAMEIEVQKFVSTKEISKERTEVREARERILRDAERKAEARFANNALICLQIQLLRRDDRKA